MIDGVAYDMSPAPTNMRQNIVGGLYALLREKLKGKTCQPFIAPMDGVLSAVDVMQPDVIVVCDTGKITERHILAKAHRIGSPKSYHPAQPAKICAMNLHKTRRDTHEHPHFRLVPERGLVVGRLRQQRAVFFVFPNGHANPFVWPCQQ